MDEDIYNMKTCKIILMKIVIQGKGDISDGTAFSGNVTKGRS